MDDEASGSGSVSSGTTGGVGNSEAPEPDEGELPDRCRVIEFAKIFPRSRSESDSSWMRGLSRRVDMDLFEKDIRSGE